MTATLETASSRAGRLLRRRRTLAAVERWAGPVWLWGLLLATLVVSALAVPDFAHWQNPSNVLQQAVPLGIVAMGETIVILTGGIDISVAATVSLGDTMAMGLMNGRSDRIWLAVLLPVLAGAVVGLVNGVITARARVPAFIVTLGMASAIQGVVFWYTGSATYGTPADAMVELGFAQWGPLPAVVVLWLPLFAAALFQQNRTRFGRHMYAVGGNEASARLAGVAVDRVKVAAYVICGATAALAGVVLTTRTGGGEPLAGIGYDWDAIAAVVIGGTLLRGGKGGLAGTVLAVAVLSVVSNVMNLAGVSAFWQSAVKGVIVLGAVMVAAIVALRPLEILRLLRERARGGRV